MSKIKILGKPKDHFPFATALLTHPSAQTFCLTAKGHGMEPSISSGDLLMCLVTDQLNNGDIAIISNGKKTHCKYYREFGSQVFYENSKMESFDAEGYEIIGKVTSTFKYL